MSILNLSQGYELTRELGFTPTCTNTQCSSMSHTEPSYLHVEKKEHNNSTLQEKHTIAAIIVEVFSVTKLTKSVKKPPLKPSLFDTEVLVDMSYN